jgi:uncharacterized protein
MSYGYIAETAASAPVSARAAFIKRTYLHLAGAILAFVGIEAALIVSGIAEDIIKQVFVQRGAWIGLMVLFIVGGMGAQYMARSRSAPGIQYAGLALYVMLEVLIFLPILTIASDPKFGIGNPMIPLQAAVVTLAVFGGLTIAVFLSGKDFSFMGPFLWVASLLSLGLVIAAAIGGFSLGLVFCGAMVALAAGFIIYDTSNIIHRYGTNQHVAASLELFSSVALLFWYILRLFLIARDD